MLFFYKFLEEFSKLQDTYHIFGTLSCHVDETVKSALGLLAGQSSANSRDTSLVFRFFYLLFQ